LDRSAKRKIFNLATPFLTHEPSPCSGVEISPVMLYTFDRTILKNTVFLLRKSMFFPLRRKEKKIEIIFVEVLELEVL
jgi:hypothetical protein